MNSSIRHSRALAVAGLVLAASAARAQTPDPSVAPVRGQVLDATTSTPVPGAVVRWLSNPAGATTTDEQGAFSLVRPAGTDNRLIINFLGYLADTVRADSRYLRVPLRRSAELGEVQVQARALAYSGLTPTNTQVITSRDLTKSACCNLAESFETNASVEVSTSDAVSGAKQIQLLGLDGAYTLLTLENLPALRGLATPYRLGYLAGPWIEGIDIIKGMGSVVNGYESIAGQVNIHLKDPAKTDRLHFNAYVNDMGKFDLNLNLATRLTPKLSTALLLHTDHLGGRIDRNDDGFLDLPRATQFNAFNKWKYNSGNGFVTEVGLGALRETRQGGQVGFREEAPGPYYGITQETNRYTGYAKASYAWAGRPYQSLGLLLSGTDHDFTSRYGRRDYDGRQRTGLATLLFQSIIGTTAHTYRTGLSFLHDDYRETYNPSTTSAALLARNRREQVPGAFGEYTYQNASNLTVVGGLRLDRHNLYGWLLTPRLNVKYDPAKNTVLRFAAGKGLRVANPLAENSGMFVSSRDFVISPDLQPEKAWSLGGSATQYFNAFGRQGTLVADYYHTEFQNQVVVDSYTAPDQLLIGNLEPGGRSYSRSFLAEVQVQPLKGLEAKAAYKYLDVQTTYSGELLPRVLVPRHRLFLNLAYATAFDKWRADLTVQGYGRRPLAPEPGTADLGRSLSPRYALLNTQITRAFKRWEVYAGVENLTNYRQRNPIQGAEAPFGPAFDAAMAWGPVYGRMSYLGMRFTLP
ncbi:TonB-dependent receptor [Hymenobacter psychrophilus]|uniref:Outer membrane receptor for ferrienterochelin and colicins n=1 Tax=Hymenobacter psychrophilus TaxID=651662 RepID=A0A1H3IVD0_9BACT|nr:TonB-dependent receptor [Hymenobacter psychrophilus]SDY31128.1 Outer membrane receptor for ferrienterochelin and colicins [Hymenobacter psychrophilus]